MLKIEPLEKILKSYPDFKPEWRPFINGGIENQKFGRISCVVVCKEDGTPLYDQYMIEEKPGVVIVPYDRQRGIIRVGLITQERHIPKRIYVEAPRGFREENETILETAYRELFEETGLHADNVKILSKINPNTTFYATSFPVVVAQFEKLEEIENPCKNSLIEKILRVKPYRFNDIRQLREKGLLECGITKAALFEFGCYMPEFYKE